ncbi:MAG TPA: DUF4249 domain-containing protein [Prolixibacteraceae bacterium]|nr:DUF4249 domain-containing protein [Prolixibacteraceae bacterium]
MKSFILIVIFALLVITSCEKVIEIDLSEFDPEPVVNCLFCPNNYFNVKVSFSQILTDTSISNPVSNAMVSIQALKGGFTKNLPYQGNGDYSDSLFFPVQNETYRLEVKIDGYKALTAIDSLPIAPCVLGAELIKTNRFDPEDQDFKYHNIRVKLKDSLLYKNFYELRVYETRSENSYASVGLKSDESFIINEGDQEFSENRILFSDELIEGQTINFTFNPKCLISNDSLWNIDFYVVAISEDFYKFRKTSIRHWAGYAKQDLFESIEPVPMFTNIQNGYGVFAGYNYHKIRLYPLN